MVTGPQKPSIMFYLKQGVKCLSHRLLGHDITTMINQYDVNPWHDIFSSARSILKETNLKFNKNKNKNRITESCSSWGNYKKNSTCIYTEEMKAKEQTRTATEPPRVRATCTHRRVLLIPQQPSSEKEEKKVFDNYVNNFFFFKEENKEKKTEVKSDLLLWNKSFKVNAIED